VPISVRDLVFSYFDEPVVRGVSADFGEGAIHLVVGATGSGKTTLGLVLAGLARPASGSVTVDGCDPASSAFDRSRLQLAFQFPEVQIFESSVAGEIEYGLRNFGLPPAEIEPRRDWAIGCVGLAAALLARDPSSLSFGERRKVALASVIALKPRYLILDEPLAGLDWHGRQSLVGTIIKLKGEGMTTLVLTHETDLVAEMGDTVTVMAGGRLEGPMPPEAFLNSGPGPGTGASEPTRSDGPDLRPDFVLALEHLKRRGCPTGPVPRTVEETARALVQSLSLGGR